MSATNPDDIHTILSRFSTWAGKQSPSGRGTLDDDGVREVSCEEVMRNLRSRRSTPRASVAEADRKASAFEAMAAADSSPVQQPAADSGAEPIPSSVSGSAAGEARLPVRPKTRKTGSPGCAKAATTRSSTLRQSQPREFREVLVKSVQRKAAKDLKSAERNQRVSVRLSHAEEQQLQRSAAQAGVTVSEYLRRRALEPSPIPSTETALAAAEVKRTSATDAGEVAATQKSTFGDWIALLRNRFLSSPPRFAERA